MGPNTTQPPGSSGLTPSLSPGQRLRVRLERPAAQGRTVARHEGLVLLVSRGAPGEDVDVEVERVETRHALARVVAVHSPAATRVPPPCPFYERCGGCDLQHLAYPAQVAFKREAFLDQLARIGGLEQPPPFEIVPAPAPLRYRDRLDFLLHPAGDTRRLRPAFHGAHGAQAIPIDDCRLAPAGLSELARALGEGLEAGPGHAVRVRVQAFASVGRAEGGAESALAITLVAPTAAAARRLTRQRERWLPALLAGQPALQHVAVAVSTPHGEQEHAEEAATLLHGEALLTKRVGAWNYLVPPDAFFQVNPDQAECLVLHVADELRRYCREITVKPSGHPAAAVMDLFCGVGLFSLPLAAAGYRVLGVEIGEEAVRAARQTAREAHARGAFADRRPEFKARNLDGKGVLGELAKRFGRPDAIVLDPPRRGLSAQLVQGLLTLRPAVIVYVSCDGGTFARDAARLARQYVLTQVKGFDLFPQTHHLEIAGTFVPRAG
jgi:23S rRNA (uracil1939-C5)-methyltransferase